MLPAMVNCDEIQLFFDCSHVQPPLRLRLDSLTVPPMEGELLKDLAKGMYGYLFIVGCTGAWIPLHYMALTLLWWIEREEQQEECWYFTSG